jgi:hypothetical protein
MLVIVVFCTCIFKDFEKNRRKKANVSGKIIYQLIWNWIQKYSVIPEKYQLDEGRFQDISL